MELLISAKVTLSDTLFVETMLSDELRAKFSLLSALSAILVISLFLSVEASLMLQKHGTNASCTKLVVLFELVSSSFLTPAQNEHYVDEQRLFGA